MKTKLLIILLLVLISCNKRESVSNAPMTYVEVSPGDIVIQRRTTEEKMTIKKLPLNCYQFTHSNVCFDFHSNITVNVQTNDNAVIIDEVGNYGYEGVYRYFTINGVFKYTSDSLNAVIVKRNGNTRAKFKVDF